MRGKKVLVLPSAEADPVKFFPTSNPSMYRTDQRERCPGQTWYCVAKAPPFGLQFRNREAEEGQRLPHRDQS